MLFKSNMYFLFAHTGQIKPDCIGFVSFNNIAGRNKVMCFIVKWNKSFHKVLKISAQPVQLLFNINCKLIHRAIHFLAVHTYKSNLNAKPIWTVSFMPYRHYYVNNECDLSNLRIDSSTRQEFQGVIIAGLKPARCSSADVRADIW